MSNLQCILIESSLSEIRLIANDTEIGIETIIEGRISEAGKIALDAKFLSDIVRRLPESEITIETNANNTAHISCERYQSDIPGTSGDDFNYLPEVEKNKSITISQFTLKDVIQKTIFSISDQENTKIMTGELFEINGDELRVVSLDGHRISIRKVKLRESYDSMKVIVPGKTLNEISRILGGEKDDPVDITFDKKFIKFSFGSTKVISRLIEGEYFNVDQMISSDYETAVKINRNDFLNTIDRAFTLTREGEKKPIIFDIRDGEINIEISSPLGSMNSHLYIHKDGKDLVIGFNPRFFLEALKVIDDEEVDIFFVNSNAPCFIRDKDGGYIYIILPVNINR